MTLQQKTQGNDLASKLDKLRKQRQSLDSGIYGKMGQTQQTAGVKQTQGNTLEAGLEHYKAYQSNCADLSSGLTNELMGFVNFVQENKQYQGLERAVQIFSKSKADSMRINRLRSSSPKQNLNVVIEYTVALVKEIQGVQEGIQGRLTELVAKTDEIVDKIRVNQPLEAEYKERLEATETVYKSLEDKIATASPAEQAKLEVEKNDLYKTLTTQRKEYDQVLETYNQAQEALKPITLARDGFDQIDRNLGIQAVHLYEKMENVHQIYEAAPEAVTAMMTTRGMEVLDKTLNVATEKSLEMISASTIGITDTTTDRQKAKLMEDAKVREVILSMGQMVERFKESQIAVSDNARRSPEERYGAQ